LHRQGTKAFRSPPSVKHLVELDDAFANEWQCLDQAGHTKTLRQKCRPN
jgi:hypothetical protein